MVKHTVDPYIINPRHPITVSLIGAGGTGSQVLQGLARMNVALQKLEHPGLHVVVIDDDVITEANIGRQLFAESEIGQFKASTLVTRINRFYGTQWESRIIRTDKQAPRRIARNIIINCVDTVSSRKEIKEINQLNQEMTIDYSKPYYCLDFGNKKNTGQVILSTIQNNDLPDLFDIFGDIPEDDDTPSCSLLEALSKQDLYINSTLANAGLALLWKMFTNLELEYHGVFLNLETMTMNPILIPNIVNNEKTNAPATSV